MKRRKAVVTLIALNVVWAMPIGAVEISGIIGFDGATRSHRWNPVLVSLAAGATPIVGTLEIETAPGPLASERESRYTIRRPIRLEPRERRLIREVVPIGRTILPVRVRVIEEKGADETRDTRSTAVPTGRVVAEESLSPALTLTDRPLILALAVAPARIAGISARSAVVTPFVEQLPEYGAGYESATLVIADRSSIARTTAAQRRALLDWIDAGGTLVWIGDHGGIERDLEVDTLRDPTGIIFVVPAEVDEATLTTVIRHGEAAGDVPPLPIFSDRVAFADETHTVLLPGLVYRYPSRLSAALPLAMVTAAFWWFASPTRRPGSGYRAPVILGATVALYLTFGVLAGPPDAVGVEVQTLNAASSTVRGILQRELLFASVAPANRRVTVSSTEVVVPTWGETLVERNGDGTLSFILETESWSHRYAVLAQRHRTPLRARYADERLVVTTAEHAVSSFATVRSTDTAFFGPLEPSSHRTLSSAELAAAGVEEGVEVRLLELRDELRRRGRRLSDGDMSVVALLRRPLTPSLLDGTGDRTITRIELEIGGDNR
ncbi:MAG: hypothetical protein MI724_07375 [Spirochaetales bacterium]|nr:hypothetical protein [Spirochaetales bacterium]